MSGENPSTVRNCAEADDGAGKIEAGKFPRGPRWWNQGRRGAQPVRVIPPSPRPRAAPRRAWDQAIAATALSTGGIQGTPTPCATSRKEDAEDELLRPRDRPGRRAGAAPRGSPGPPSSGRRRTIPVDGRQPDALLQGLGGVQRGHEASEKCAQKRSLEQQAAWDGPRRSGPWARARPFEC